ncbi:MAG: ABC transporter permease [Anaerolineales bacterium]|nr:ABC transporter permease [Anaerolineales bacterium]
MVLPVLLLLVTSALFLLILQLPIEQRVQVYLPSGNPNKTEEQAEKVMQEMIQRYGLDKPFPIQYLNWISGLARGDWGYSPMSRQGVLEGLLQRAPASIELALFSLIPSIFFALYLGGVSARNHNRPLDQFVRGFALLGWAIPPFILGLVLMNVFYAWTGWFPPERLSHWAKTLVESDTFNQYTRLHTIDSLLNGNPRLFLDAIRHLVLPGATLAAVEWALFVRIMRSSMLVTLRQDYIKTAKSKGLKNRAVINRHARPNAVLPVISTTSVAASLFFTSLVIIEVVFNINGIGRWAANAILNVDIPVAVGFAVASCTLVVLATLAADVLYAVVDPRVRVE